VFSSSVSWPHYSRRCHQMQEVCAYNTKMVSSL
jgi:hypothetical protein